jgi:hypothetical protein
MMAKDQSHGDDAHKENRLDLSNSPSKQPPILAVCMVATDPIYFRRFRMRKIYTYITPVMLPTSHQVSDGLALLCNRRAYQLAESLKKAVGCLTPSERRPREQIWTATVQAIKSN